MLEAGACMCRSPEARLSLAGGVAAPRSLPFCSGPPLPRLVGTRKASTASKYVGYLPSLTDTFLILNVGPDQKVGTKTNPSVRGAHGTRPTRHIQAGKLTSRTNMAATHATSCNTGCASLNDPINRANAGDRLPTTDLRKRKKPCHFRERSQEDTSPPHLPTHT